MALPAAEEVGQKLLNEVEEINLSEILQELQSSLSDDRCLQFNVPALDTLIEAAGRTDHGGSGRRARPPVVEIMSTSPGAGKTQLLYHAVAAAVLPVRPFLSDREDRSSSSGGKGGCAVIIDTEMNFDVLRLAKTLRGFLYGLLERENAEPSTRPPSRSASAPASDIDEEESTAHDQPREVTLQEIVSHALRHVHVFQPSTLPSLIATAQSLEAYLLDATAHHSSNRPLALLALNSLTTFLPQARHAADLARADPTSTPPAPHTTPQAYAVLARTIRALQTTFRAPMLITAAGLHPVPRTGTSAGPSATRPLVFRPVLGGAWRALVTARLGVEAGRVRPFGDLDVAGAERDREMRETALRGAGFAVWVVADGDAGGPGVGRGFGFAVGEDGQLVFRD